MTSISICAYPWDLIDDPSAGQRLAATGASRVAIAAAYHSVRAATPLHPEHRLVDADTAAIYVPLRPKAWAASRLIPRQARPRVSGARHLATDSFARASATALAAGLEVDAWAVLLHSTALGQQHPELCVRNAFGDIYTYALCPGNAEVIQYAVTLTSEIAHFAGESGATGLMIEACGPLGVSHLGHHEKTVGAEWGPIEEALLSLCFCPGCSEGMREAGLDAKQLAGIVREALSQDSGSVEKALVGYSMVLRQFREGTTNSLAARVSAAAREAGMNRLIFHAQPDPWAVGPFVSLGATSQGRGLPGAVSDAIFFLPGAVARTLGPDEVSSLAATTGASALGAYVSALPPENINDLPRDWKKLRNDGFDELCIYHFGLMSRNRLIAVGEAVASLTMPAPPNTLQ